MDPFGPKKKSNKKAQDSLDDLLGDLLEPDETPKKKPAQGRGRAVGKQGSKDGDFYSNLAAMAENDVDSDISDADVEKMAKSISGLDDMDADLFGDSLKKKGSVKSNSKQSTPRRSAATPRSNSVTPRSAAERVNTPRSETPTSPPGSARGSLKRKPVKPTASSTSASPLDPKPGTAPGQMTDIGRASENLRPGQTKEEKRPNTTPKQKPKYDFGEFDEDDPLAGLSLDEDSISEAAKKPAPKKDGPVKQKSQEEEQKPTTQPAAQPSSPRKPNLFERPPTRSGSGNNSTEAGDTPVAQQAKPAEPAAKRKDDFIFSDDDNLLDGLGIDSTEKKPQTTSAPTTPTPASTLPAKPKSADEDQRPARSVFDSLLGRGEKSAASHLEVKEKPKQFVLDKKYMQPKEEKKEEEDDFLFGSYQPSAASGGGSRPSSRRSVRFQDDDDIFGVDKPSDRPGSASSARKNIPDDMRWLEELTSGETTPSTNKTATTTSVTPSSPAKTAPHPSSPVKTTPAKPTGDSSSILKTPAMDSQKPAETTGILKESPRDKPTPSGSRDVSPERLLEKPKKPDPKDWLGLKESDSDGEYFIPKRDPSRSLGITDLTPRTPPSVRMSRSPPRSGSDGGQKPVDDDEEEDSFIVRARARRQAAMANQGKEKPAASQPAAVTPAQPVIPQMDSPRFQGSVPVPLQDEGQAPRDLFAFPPTRAASAPKFETDVRATQSTGFVVSTDNRAGRDVTQPVGVPQSQMQSNLMSGISSGTSPRLMHSRHFDAREAGGDMSVVSGPSGLQQQPQQQQQIVPQLQLGTSYPQSTSLPTILSAGPQSYYAQQVTSVGPPPLPATYSSVSVHHEPIPASLEEAAARIRKLEIEKQYAESLLETTRKRYEEEVMAVERSYKNRIQILEEANQKTETRLRGEMEQLMEQHLARVKRMEQEKADLAAENYRKLEEQERTFAQETEKLKEKHRQMVAELKREHEESQQQLIEAKNKEIQKVAAAHDTSRSLSAAVEQIQNNARDLGQLQIKMDEWNRAGLDEREIALRSKDEQLNMLQARLKKQEEDNEKERHRLEDLIARMESQNRDQLRQIEEDRWKLKQEQSRLEALQTALETERRTWMEQQARERQSMDRARDMFLEEQQSGLSHLTDERRALAEERSKLNIEQKMHRERMQQEAVRSAQAQAEYDVLIKTISEEKARASERMRELQREEDRISAERDRLQHQLSGLEQEKSRLEKLAVSLRQRSADLDSVSEEANMARARGEQALSEAQLIQSQQAQRQAEVEAQIASIKVMEDHIAQEKVRLAKEKKDVENTKQAGMCVNCRNMLHAVVPQQVQPRLGATLSGSVLAGSPLAGTPVPQAPTPGIPAVTPGIPAVGMVITSTPYETVASSIASDRAVRMWKIQAIKDQEFLEEESLFLEGLKHSPYHSTSPTK